MTGVMIMQRLISIDKEANMDINKIPVATVLQEGVVRIYGPVEQNGVRPFLEQRQFANRGQALEFAREFDQRQRKR